MDETRDNVSDTSHTPSQVANAGEALQLKPLSPSFPELGGRSSVVYAATADSKAEECVVKCFQMTQEEQFKNERDHFLHLQRLAVSGRFPSLLGVAPRELGAEATRTTAAVEETLRNAAHRIS